VLFNGRYSKSKERKLAFGGLNKNNNYPEKQTQDQEQVQDRIMGLLSPKKTMILGKSDPKAGVPMASCKHNM
jgi:hypothetical protein